MNLNAYISPYVGSINPLTPVGIRISVGQGPTGPDGVRPPLYATPGALIGSVAASILTVAALSSGVLQPGQALFDATAALAAGTAITAQLSGSPGGPGTYSLNREQTVASEAMTTAVVALAQIQPIETPDLQQLEGLNLGGEKKVIYLNGDLNGVVRVLLKGGDLVTFPDGSAWLVAKQLEGFNMTAGWTKAALVLQNGS